MLWKKRKPPVSVTRVSGPDMLHRFLLDSQIDDAQALSLLLGLPPLEDPDEEVSLSNERVVRAAIVIPIVRTFSQAMAYSVVEMFRTHDADTDDALTDRQAAVLKAMIDTVATSTALGTVTQLEDLGLINYVWSEK